jgi:hypothetical protein
LKIIEILATAILSFIGGVGLERYKQKCDREKELQNIDGVLKYYFAQGESNLLSSHAFYKEKVLANKGLKPIPNFQHLILFPKIDSETLKSRLGKVAYGKSNEVSTAINALLLLSEQINRALDECRESFEKTDDNSLRQAWALFDHQCKFHYLVTRLKNEKDRFVYFGDSSQEVAEKVANSYRLPYHIDEIVNDHITSLGNGRL